MYHTQLHHNYKNNPKNTYKEAECKLIKELNRPLKKIVSCIFKYTFLIVNEGDRRKAMDV